jgi:RNA exonuclease 4
MVGVRNNTRSALARVSIVDYNGHIVFDEYVKPLDPVSDYRTWVSGIHPHHLAHAPSFKKVQKQVANILKGKVLIGHAINNDLKALQLSFPESMIRDTSLFPEFKKFAKGKKDTPGLKMLAKKLLDLDIQSSSHDSVEDARTTMLLFQQGMEEWTDYDLN